ncbi:MAG: hypothetical protein U1C72_00805, partial [Candidatus Pacearchaeota archaeon]|nr:hypothetical protein [Candidatus Pacearchaeota archaeon]
MATTQRAERRPAPQHNGTWLLLGVAITLIVLAGIILLTRSSGSEQTSGVNTAANTTAQVPSQAQLAGATTQNYKFGEYSRPSTTPLPQIKDPAEMVASFFWLNTSRRFQHKY